MASATAGVSDAPTLNTTAVAGPTTAPVRESARKRAISSYRKLPLSFVPNAGQTDKRVRYYAQGAGHVFYFTPQRVVLSMTKGKRKVALDLTPLGVNPNAKLVATDRGSARVNYLIGSERHTNLPTYHKLIYRNLWRGIDLVFWGARGRLNYELHLKPGADPEKIRLAYRGADRLSLAPNGDLRVKTALGVLPDSRPRSYQRVGGSRAVESRFVLEGGETTFGFAVGTYDARRPLVIDPGLSYSTYLGGAASSDAGNGIAVDGAGSAYVTGYTGSPDFPTSAGTLDTSANGSYDGFVAKLEPTGSALSYSTYLGGAGTDFGNGIAVDSAGSAYVTGYTLSSNFPTSGGALDTSANGSYDGFVAKLDPTGSALSYSTYLGGSANDYGYGIALDSAGSAYVAGYTSSPNFPTSAGALDTSLSGGTEAIVTKLDPTGSALSYSTFLGGSGTDFGHAIALDSAGSAYLTGNTGSSDFPTSAGALDTSFNGSVDAFVAKLDPTGSALSYSTYLGGSANDSEYAIALDSAGSAYVTGYTSSPDFPRSAGALDTSFSGGTEAIVTKLNPTGSALSYSTYLGGSDEDYGYGVAVDGAGSAYVTGQTSSSDFPASVGALDASFNGSIDAFVAKLDSTGSALSYSTYLGGSGTDIGFGIVLDSVRSIYVTGNTGSSNFPTSAGALDTSFNGSGDAFVTKLDLIPPDPPTFTATDPASPAADNSPKVRGSAETSSTVKLYASSNCSDVLAATGSAEDFASPGLTVSVPDGSITTFHATATDAADNTSACSSDSITYTQITFYPRPKGATPTRLSLVPAYKQCTAPTVQHGAPLAYGSCDPPQQASDWLTVGTPDSNGQAAKSIGSVLYQVVAGDVQISVSTTDVRNRSDLSDYTGELQADQTLRITDRQNGPSQNESATGEDIRFPVTVPCAATSDATVGSTCSVSTSANAVVPGAVTAGNRTIWELGQLQVFDGGSSGTAGAADATRFEDAGIFVP